MRVEPLTVDCFAHCLKRGGRGIPIVKEERDKWRFLRSLYYLNDVFFDENWDRATHNSQTVAGDANTLFRRLPEWPARKPLVKIVCYMLMPNHIHLLLKEIRSRGITVFMKKLGQSMTNHFNLKYKTRGSIFQGAYKSRTIRTDEYLRHVSVYIMVKNAFELFPEGLEAAVRDFEKAWRFATAYPFSSLGDYTAGRDFPIIDTDLVGEIFKDPRELKSFAREVIEGGRWKEDTTLNALLIE